MPRTGRPKTSTDVEFDCIQCGKHCIQPEWENTTKRFCSRECYHQNRIGKEQPWNTGPPDEKKCPECGKLFLVGGEGRPPRHRVHCSRKCDVASRKYRTECRLLPIPPPEIQSATYIAGFVDGEGCISFYKKGISINVKLIACNCKRFVLDWIVKQTGVGAVTRHHFATDKHAESFYWQCNSKAAVSVLRQIEPYLILKREQANLAIRVQELHEARAFWDNPDLRDQFLTEIRRLNQRGPQLNG
jgi:endogenous inhibitor of DNA gyrase (YacG/DUF329 family)